MCDDGCLRENKGFFIPPAGTVTAGKQDVFFKNRDTFFRYAEALPRLSVDLRVFVTSQLL